MPYDSDSGLYTRRSTTVIDATPDGDTVAQAIGVKLDDAADDAVTDLNHHNANAGHYPTPADTTSAQVLRKSPSGSVTWDNGTWLISSADAFASAAESSAGDAAASASAAAGSAISASNSADEAKEKFDAMDRIYLGALPADPATDNQGGALVVGAIYYNTTDGEIRTYTGSEWITGVTSGVSSLNGMTGDLELAPVNVTSPGPICVTQEKTLQITNHDGFSTYTVSATRGTATISGDTITYTAPATDGADTLTVTLSGVGRDIALDILPAAVSAPTITSPAESAEISPSNVTIITSAFAPIGSADTHAKSQYVIRDSGGAVIYDSGESDDLTSITIPSPGLTRGESYTIEARHKGAALGWSEWSTARGVSVSVITRGMRIDNKATVIGNADGTPFSINGQQVWIAVLDAAYRGVSIKFGTYGYDSTLPNVTSSLGTMTQGESESAMDARAAAETGNSKGNCDVWMTRNGITDSQSIVGVPAVAMCRALSLDGTPCDLPTAKVLMRIWQHRDFIDTNDPTAAANTAKKLSAWGFGSANGANVWSSSEYTSDNAVRVNSSGNVNDYTKDLQFGVVPVLEIPA